ncbi:MAG: hypothetical protein K1X28_04995 [Parachlamydiales bacterium]|nr:hypothetical protein [Parachlamydiales bacterium]
MACRNESYLREMIPIDPGEVLQQACSDREYAKALEMLQKGHAFAPYDLGMCLEMLSRDDQALDTIKTLTLAGRFEEVCAPFVDRAFQQALGNQCPHIVEYFLSHKHLSKELSSDAIFQGLMTCQNIPILNSLRGAFAALEEPVQRKYYVGMVEVSRYEEIAEFAKVPECKKVLDRCLGDIVLTLARKKPPGVMHKVLSLDWVRPISIEDLAMVAAEMAMDYTKFIELLMHPLYDKVDPLQIGTRLTAASAQKLWDEWKKAPSQDLCLKRIPEIALYGQIFSESVTIEMGYLDRFDPDIWHKGLKAKIEGGGNEFVVRFFLFSPHVLLHLHDKHRESLFLTACETSDVHPNNWIAAKAILFGVLESQRARQDLTEADQKQIAALEDIQAKFSQQVVEAAAMLAIQKNLPFVLRMLARTEHYKKMSLNVLFDSFIDAAGSGRIAVAKEILMSRDWVGKEEELFDYLLESPCKELLDVYVQLPCFDRVKLQSLKKAFLPMIKCGRIRGAEEDHQVAVAEFQENFPKMAALQSMVVKILGKYEVPMMFSDQEMDKICAIYFAFVGMGFFTHIGKFANHQAMPNPMQILAAEQACAGSSFFIFYQTDDGYAGKPIEIPQRVAEDRKGSILSHLLGGVWVFRDFRVQATRDLIDRLFLLAADMDSLIAMKAIKEGCQGEYNPKTVDQAFQIAQRNKNQAMIEYLFPSGACVIS